MSHLVADCNIKLGNDFVVKPGEAVPPDVAGLDDLLDQGALHWADEPGGDPAGEPVRWRAQMHLEKYEGDDPDARAANPDEAPDAVIDTVENLLTIGGASILWEKLMGGTGTVFDATNAYLAVGDSTTAAADTQTDLVAATNKLRKAQDSTYPQHSDSTSVAGAKSIVYKSTFTTSDANFAWQEWALMNASSAGRMLNRKVESLGTKTSAAAWTLTVTLSLA